MYSILDFHFQYIDQLVFYGDFYYADDVTMAYVTSLQYHTYHQHTYNMMLLFMFNIILYVTFMLCHAMPCHGKAHAHGCMMGMG